MTRALQFPPFPPLSWDGLYWRGHARVPWYSTSREPEVVLRPDYSRSIEPADADSAPRPSGPQAAAFQFVFDPDSPLRQTVSVEIRKFVPELAEADWAGIETMFELATVIVFHPDSEGVSYTGLVLNCLQWDLGYEHGVGIVAHRDRVVHFGMAEEGGDEQVVRKDLRKIARRGGNKR